MGAMQEKRKGQILFCHRPTRAKAGQKPISHRALRDSEQPNLLIAGEGPAINNIHYPGGNFLGGDQSWGICGLMPALTQFLRQNMVHILPFYP